jgi:hypothetical protein
MLTTEVVKGLLEGKVYRRTVPTPFNTWEEIRVKAHRFFTRNNSEKEWVAGSFTPTHFEFTWEEVIQWKEIDWKEAVDCEEKNVPLQFFGLEIGLGWIDNTKAFENCSFSFVRKHKWRKKVNASL